MATTRTADDVYAEITALKLKLSSTVSDIGDYKIMKTLEAQITGSDAPYDTDALIAERQAVRDQINELQTEYETLMAAGTTSTEE